MQSRCRLDSRKHIGRGSESLYGKAGNKSNENGKEGLHDDKRCMLVYLEMKNFRVVRVVDDES